MTLWTWGGGDGVGKKGREGGVPDMTSKAMAGGRVVNGY